MSEYCNSLLEDMEIHQIIVASVRTQATLNNGSSASHRRWVAALKRVTAQLADATNAYNRYCAGTEVVLGDGPPLGGGGGPWA